MQSISQTICLPVSGFLSMYREGCSHTKDLASLTIFTLKDTPDTGHVIRTGSKSDLRGGKGGSHDRQSGCVLESAQV
jgi:hypothetical protein